MFNSWLYQIFLEAVGLEQGIIEELLEWKVAALV
jgi:hypothetical protein